MNVADASAAILEATRRGRSIAVATMVEPPTGARLLVDADGRRGSLGEAELDRHVERLARGALEGAPAGTHRIPHRDETVRVLVEAHHPQPQLVVVGAGHISLPLARMALVAGFRVLVLDDRSAFADAGRFPPGVEVLRIDFDEPFRDVELGPLSHVVLVTRAHRYDFDCLRRLLERDARVPYVGIIGSRRRVRAAFEALVEDGVDAALLESVRAPVGLGIGAETPAEIAVSILAEIVATRRGLLGTKSVGRPLTESNAVARRLPQPEEAR